VAGSSRSIRRAWSSGSSTSARWGGFHGWFGGFHRFENGNTLVANSDWHYREPRETAVQLVEVTRDKRAVWKLGVEKFSGKKPGSLEPGTGLVEQRIIGVQWLGEAAR
jgi:hypothetical protein